MRPGPHAMLYPDDSARFLSIVEARGNELNYLTTEEAMLVCQKLTYERARYATECLTDLGSWMLSFG
jgi:hypothetical protein